MAGCGYVCPVCEGRGYDSSGEKCTYCVKPDSFSYNFKIRFQNLNYITPMRKLDFFIFCLMLLAFACEKKTEPKKEADTAKVDSAKLNKPKVSLEEAWSTDTVLTTCESVIFDKAKKSIYVANINGKPDSMDKNGFISKLTLDGKIENLKWITGLNAPKGMGIYKNKLYVTDINSIAEIDIEKGKVIKKYPVKGAKFLNDITVDTAGLVYFSDSETGKIHTLKNGKVEDWKDGFKRPNGLLSMGDKLYLATSEGSDFRVFDVPSKKDSVIATEIGKGDGVVYTGKEGSFIVSEWTGTIFYIAPNEKPVVILDTKEKKLNTADIEYIQDQNLLLVPTFFGNKVQAYKVKM
jgi:hypothetical protein